MSSFLTVKYNKIILSSLMIVLSFLIMAQAALAETGADKALGGLKTTGETGFDTKEVSLWQGGPVAIIGKIVGVVLAFLGVVFFVLILYAGLTWILSMGKEEKINQAKDMIMAAVLGLIVVLGAYAITNLIAQIFTQAVPK